MYSDLKNKNSNGFPYYVDLHVESGKLIIIINKTKIQNYILNIIKD